MNAEVRGCEVEEELTNPVPLAGFQEGTWSVKDAVTSGCTLTTHPLQA